MMFADRTSCHSFEANRFRLPSPTHNLLSSCDYVLVETLCRTALADTDMVKVQCRTIRVKLFKIAAVMTESVRRIVFFLPNVCPTRELWLRIFRWFRVRLSIRVGPTCPSRLSAGPMRNSATSNGGEGAYVQWLGKKEKFNPPDSKNA